ncbi:MAG: hypothetical protein ACJ8FU_20580 [Xanthobacteraceae bacterium]
MALRSTVGFIVSHRARSFAWRRFPAMRAVSLATCGGMETFSGIIATGLAIVIRAQA